MKHFVVFKSLNHLSIREPLLPLGHCDPRLWCNKSLCLWSIQFLSHIYCLLLLSLHWQMHIKFRAKMEWDDFFFRAQPNRFKVVKQTLPWTHVSFDSLINVPFRLLVTEYSTPCPGSSLCLWSSPLSGRATEVASPPAGKGIYWQAFWETQSKGSCRLRHVGIQRRFWLV